MDTRSLIRRIAEHESYARQVVHVEELPARPAVHGHVPGGVHPAVQRALEAQGIAQLYRHQAEAIEAIHNGDNVVIVTGTASGKTLCYNVPVAEELARNPIATALYVFPTKALTQDQLRSIGRFRLPECGLEFVAGTYDGDTPTNVRRKLRDEGNVILTNPDMLHQGILPQHSRWSRFFSHLRYVVIDEVHAYRGVFGSNLANVMRRLHRVCRHYGSSPQFICCSATIGNPKEHAERITGSPIRLVTGDGSPRGAKRFVLWNPPPIGGAMLGQRRSPLEETIWLLSQLVSHGVQTIAFVRTRLSAELIFRGVRERLREKSLRLAEAVHAYRGGYLPEERRSIEQRLVRKEILGVASTNALELGIDIGSLDACIIVGYPGTIASLWQQAGRAGRGCEDAVVFLVGQNSPIDQYLMSHCEYLFEQSPEHAVVDPNNPHIALGHIGCTVHELPLPDAEVAAFGPYADTILELLEEQGSVCHIDGAWYWASSEYPASAVSLRNIAGPVYTIQEDADGRVIGTMDEASALSQLHTHAVYIHGADTYLVHRLDLEHKVAHVERRDLDYYTQAVQVSHIRIEEKQRESQWRECQLGFGDVAVTTTIPMFKKIRFHRNESLGYEQLEMPPQTLETVGLWFAPGAPLVSQLAASGMVVGEALTGVANVLVEVAPLFVMCDPQDIGAVVDASCLGCDALFVFDRYPGGMGYAQRCLERISELMETVRNVLRECPCRDGCPSCVGSALPAFAMTDLDSAARDRIPNKDAARTLMELLMSQRG